MTNQKFSNPDRTNMQTPVSRLELTDSANRSQTVSKWYHNPMMLLVVGIPLLSIVISFIFMTIAIRSFDGVVVDDYYRQGKEINRVLMRDETARLLGLHAEVRFKDKQVQVNLQADQSLNWPTEIQLGILHPTQNGRDISLVLEATSPDNELIGFTAQYKSSSPEFRQGEWLLQLASPTWRLLHRGLTSADSVVVLKP